MDPMLLCPGKGLVLPNLNTDDIPKHARFLILSLRNNEMSRKSPFIIHKALIGIGGEPKSIKKLRSDSPLTVSPHRTLNSCRGVISEPDLLCASETEILEGLSDQGVTQYQRFGHSQTSCRGQLTCSRCASVGHASTDCVLEPKCINCSQAHSADSKLCLK
ncbi:uncharacterized protein TNCV_4652231 [Trichonephila clavipes]|nr:uncharacterized protein TNCV_4652231 [Trichonephila clavipes]